MSLHYLEKYEPQKLSLHLFCIHICGLTVFHSKRICCVYMLRLEDSAKPINILRLWMQFQAGLSGHFAILACWFSPFTSLLSIAIHTSIQFVLADLDCSHDLRSDYITRVKSHSNWTEHGPLLEISVVRSGPCSVQFRWDEMIHAVILKLLYARTNFTKFC